MDTNGLEPRRREGREGKGWRDGANGEGDAAGIVIVDESKVGRPWRKRRWVAVIAAWLLIAYVAGIGPVTYGSSRGWVPEVVAVPLLLPVRLAMEFPVLRPPVDRYLRWWNVMALEHEGYEVWIDEEGLVQAYREIVDPR